MNNVLIQGDREVASSYQAFGTPAAVVIDRSGRVASPLAQGATAIGELVAWAVHAADDLARAVDSGDRRDAGGHDVVHNGGARRNVPRAAATVGQPAPTVPLADLDGAPVDIADFAGRDLVALFWNPQCGFCERMLPQLRAWEASSEPNRPELLVVSTGDPDTNREMALRSRVVLDKAFQAGRAFGATGTPSAVHIDPAGRIATHFAVGAPAILTLLNSVSNRRIPGRSHAVRP